MKLFELLESTNGHLVKDLEDSFFVKFREAIMDDLEIFKIRFERNPDLLKQYSWPKKAEEVFESGSLLSFFESAIIDALSRLGNDKELIGKFNITKPVSINVNHRMERGSAAIDAGNPASLKIMYSGGTVDDFNEIFAAHLLNLKKPTKASIGKWVTAVEGLINPVSLDLKGDPAFKGFLQSLLHELTHASQASKRKIDVDDTTNVFGKKFIDVYLGKIRHGVMDRDYYGSFDEIDSYANELGAKLIQQADGVAIPVQGLENQISHPAYDIFKEISKEVGNKEAGQFKKAWRRFVKRVVQNVNVYNDRVNNPK